MTKKSYTLIGDMPMLFDGRPYGEGDIIEMEEADAQVYVDAGRFGDDETEAETKPKTKPKTPAKNQTKLPPKK